MQVASYSPAPAVRNSQVSHNRSVSIAASVLLAKPGSTSETPTRPALRHNRSLTQPPPGSTAAWQLAAAPPPGHEAAVNAQSSRPRPSPRRVSLPAHCAGGRVGALQLSCTKTREAHRLGSGSGRPPLYPHLFSLPVMPPPLRPQRTGHVLSPLPNATVTFFLIPF